MSRRLLLTVLLLIFLFESARAQQKIAGMVLDSSTMTVMPFVNVQVQNSGQGTNTDSLGRFRIMAKLYDTLVFSFVGYKILSLPLTSVDTILILMSEQVTILKQVVVRAQSLSGYYKDLFTDQHAAWGKFNSKKSPFYHSRERNEKHLVNKFSEDKLRVKIYMDYVANNGELKSGLSAKYALSDSSYYAILARFNEESQSFMYYVTAPELITLINAYYQKHAGKSFIDSKRAQ